MEAALCSRVPANSPPPPLSAKPASIRSVRPPPTPLSALNRSFIVMGNTFQSGSALGSVYQDEFSVRNAPLRTASVKSKGRYAEAGTNTRSPPSVTMDPIERPTSPYSASMSFYQAHKSAPSLGSFGTDVTYVEEAPTSQSPTTEKTKKGRRSRLRSFFRSKKSKGQPSPSSEADTPSAPEYPLESDPFSDYIGRPASPPLPSPKTMASCDSLVGSTPTGARKARVLRKMHRPLPIDVPITAYEDKEFLPSSHSDNVPAGFVRVPIPPLPLWAQQMCEDLATQKALSAKEAALKAKEVEERESARARNGEPVYFHIDPGWDAEDDESVCFKYVNSPAVMRHVRNPSDDPLTPISRWHPPLPGAPPRVRAVTHLGVVDTQVPANRL
ncbi:hypothetical protein BDZ89DRAFT_458432 [Hymenopellis radicata]|nr:hypothetical protein BDZ89DRAFT_458432 [Hymenopellis radicata]